VSHASRARAGALVVAVLLVAAASCAKPPRVTRPDPALLERDLEVGGRERSYLFFAPPGADPKTPRPLVLVFHGGGGSATSAARLTRFRPLAAEQGFLVAFPNAVGGHWNDGRDDDFAASMRENVDDVAFVDALIDDVARTHAVDPRRIYATGVSNGGIFVHRLAAERASRIAAIAPVVGGIAEPFAKRFAPAAPVSVLVIQATDDPLMPYDGGAVEGGGRGRIVATDTAVHLWSLHDGCPRAVRSERLPDSDPTDGCLATLETRSGCRDGSVVSLLRLDGGGHTWPGGPAYLPRSAVGAVCRDVDATRTIWAFFAAHPKPE
jgi:polyhydroxybutyrate depolymerase